ncbi:aldehyde dehydrogenase family protein [Halocalculus aciditolerans]|uniref:Aldehyde dehydrogenase n=1 Tax=Halocalculus aciditolerans TaxID=1383812 RepID=A0A830FI39_9EURY|nr:aldehyde dehydrogenase family protein [Halocalculus aciditolerans]GGL57399.1 aldehyde dehydrogenase [Halocalculus aciditolerans]
MNQLTVPAHQRPYVDGQWRDGADAIAVTDLADGGVFTHVGAAGVEAAEDALAAAHRVKPALRDASIPQRYEWLNGVADGIADRREELAETIVREAGKPISSARGEVDSAVERFRRAAEEARQQKGEYREGTTAGHENWQAVVKPEPRGLALCITPYNYPLATTALQVAPALAAGNSVVLKPASKTPVTAAVLADVVADAGLPDGAFNFLPGDASEIGDYLAGDDRVNAIAMTGSSSAGKHVAKQAGLVELHMELGGNAPEIVFADADLADAAADAAAGSVKYAGQRCSAVSRVLAQDAVHDDLVARIDDELDSWTVGDLFDDDTDLGPVIDESQAEWVQELVDDAVENGADLVRGGEYEKQAEGVYVYEPTLLADVPHDARIIREEQFGPVAAVTRFDTEAKAVALANDTDLALDAAVFTSDYDRALRVADRVQAGAVRINGRPSHGLGDIPFGGRKSSGIGREGLDSSIDAFTTTKSIIL